MARQITISPSQLDAMSCRLAWHWGYKRGFRAKKRNINLALGDGIHQSLEAYYGESRNDPVEFFTAWADAEILRMNPQWTDEITEMGEARDLGIGMLTGYVEYAKEHDNFEVITTEHTLRRMLPIPGQGGDSPYQLVVRLDALIRDGPSGKLFSLEHKTFTRFDRSHLDRDHQITAQVWAGESLALELGLDEPVIGVLYNGLRKQLPGSRTRNALFERHKIFRSDQQVKIFLHRAYWQAYDVNQPEAPIYPQPNPIRCGQCDFKTPCLAYTKGEDYMSVLDELYDHRARARREPQVQTSEEVGDETDA